MRFSLFRETSQLKKTFIIIFLKIKHIQIIRKRAFLFYRDRPHLTFVTYCCIRCKIVTFCVMNNEFLLAIFFLFNNIEVLVFFQLFRKFCDPQEYPFKKHYVPTKVIQALLIYLHNRASFVHMDILNNFLNSPQFPFLHFWTKILLCNMFL